MRSNTRPYAWRTSSYVACASCTDKSNEYKSFIRNSFVRSNPARGRGSSRNLRPIWYTRTGRDLALSISMPTNFVTSSSCVGARIMSEPRRSLRRYNSWPIASKRPVLCHRAGDSNCGISTCEASTASISSSIMCVTFLSMRMPIGRYE